MWDLKLSGWFMVASLNQPDNFKSRAVWVHLKDLLLSRIIPADDQNARIIQRPSYAFDTAQRMGFNIGDVISIQVNYGNKLSFIIPR